MRPRKFADRSQKTERLDDGDYTDKEYALWVREMRWINRYLGDSRALRMSIRDHLDGYEGHVSILDVGAGSGELLKTAGKAFGKVKTVLVGAELSGKAAREIHSGSARSGILSVQCDAMRLPFAANSFDFVISSLFLHHLADHQAVFLLSELGRVARRRVIVIDLHRHRVAYHLFNKLSRPFLQPFTHADGSLSILRSYRPNELMVLAEAANFASHRVKRRFPFRLVLSAHPTLVNDAE